MSKHLVGNRLNKDGTQTKLMLTLDGKLEEGLQRVKHVVTKKDFDYVAIVSGRVGQGKSTFAMQLAKYFDHSFDLEKVCFTAEDFIRVTTSCKPFSSVILDEAFLELNTKVSMSGAFLRIQNHLSIIRKRNLFIFIVLPDFFDLHQSMAINRSENLFYVYGKRYGDRDSFAAFKVKNKRMLYIRGKKYHEYNAWKATIRGTFTKLRTIDERLYEDKKDLFLKEQDKSQKNLSRADVSRIRLMKYLIENKVMSQREISKICRVSEASTSLMLSRNANVH